MKKVHVLKTINPYFDDTWEGNKLFEVRVNDRDYNIEDELVLKEYDEKKGCFLNRTVSCKINYILNLNFLEGLELNYVVLGLKDFTVI